MPVQRKYPIKFPNISFRNVHDLVPDEEKKREAEKKCSQNVNYHSAIDRDKSGTEQKPTSFEKPPDLNLTDLTPPNYHFLFGCDRGYRAKIKPPDQTTEELMEAMVEEKVPPPSALVTGLLEIVEPSQIPDKEIGSE